MEINTLVTKQPLFSVSSNRDPGTPGTCQVTHDALLRDPSFLRILEGPGLRTYMEDTKGPCGLSGSGLSKAQSSELEVAQNSVFNALQIR